MSETQLFVFVEGITERYFYSQITEAECGPRGIVYCVVMAEELYNGKGGGKEALLGFLRYLKEEGALEGKFEGKRTVPIFFLDKDVDEFKGGIVEENEVVYTKGYEYESYLFSDGRITQAASGAAGLDLGRVRDALGEQEAWREKAARQWKEWVKLCLFAGVKGPGRESFYGRNKSGINQGIRGSVDQAEYERHKKNMQPEGMDGRQFEEAFERLSVKVEQLYDEREFDVVFKGKWYFEFLLDDLQGIPGNVRLKQKALRETLRSALEQTLNFHEPWAEHLRGPVREVVGRLVESDPVGAASVWGAGEKGAGGGGEEE